MTDNGMDDLLDFLEDDALKTPPIKSRKYPEGKIYTVESPDAETGIRLTALAELGVKLNNGVEISEKDMARLNLSDEDEREFAQQVLGSVYEELLADGVSWVRVQRLTQYAYVHFAFSPEAARDGARKGVFSGKAPARNRAQRRAEARTTGGAHRAPQDSTATRGLRIQ